MSFRGAIALRSLPGRKRCSQNEVITLGTTAVTWDMSREAQESTCVLSSRSALKGGRAADNQSPPSTGTWPLWLHGELRRHTRVSPHRRAWPLINHSRQWVVETGENNRCQSSLHVICCLSKFQIISQLRRKMKARMLFQSDILINYFLLLKNWLILHVTLEPCHVCCIAELWTLWKFKVTVIFYCLIVKYKCDFKQNS